MTKIDKKKLLQSVITWAAIGLLGITLAVGQSVKQNSDLGKKAYEQVQAIGECIKKNEREIKDNKAQQDIINAVVSEKLNTVGEDVKDIKRMVEQLYINMGEGR